MDVSGPHSLKAPPAGAGGRRAAVRAVDGEAHPQCAIVPPRWVGSLASPRRRLITPCPPALLAGAPPSRVKQGGTYRGSRSFGAKNNDLLQVFVFTSLFERFSLLRRGIRGQAAEVLAVGKEVCKIPDESC